LSYGKIEIEEVDEFEEFEELPRTVADPKLKEDLSTVVDKAEAEVTVEVLVLKLKIVRLSLFS